MMNVRDRKFSLILIISLITLFSIQLITAADYVPPAGSPLALNQHPRVLISAAQVPAIRDYINQWYATEYQMFIDAMDSSFDDAPSAYERNYQCANAMNYAFLYLMDPGVMNTYTYAHSREQYRQKAYQYGVDLANNFSFRSGHSTGSLTNRGDGGFVNIAATVVYDWLYPTLSQSEKIAIVDGLIWRFDNRDSNSNPGELIQLSNHELGYNHVVAGALGFWGDPLGASYEAKAQQMLNHFRDMWIDRVFDLTTHVMEGSSSWGEGQNYYFLSYHIMAWMASAASSATGINWFERSSFLHYHPWNMFYRLNPYPYENEHYFSRSDAIDYAESQNQGVTRMVTHATGALKDVDPEVAAFGKYYYDNFGVSLDSDIRLYGLMYYFLNGYKDITAQTPEQLNMPKTIRMGLGETVLRSDFTDNATRITFWTPKYFLTPHAHYDNSSFTIDKFGPLALDAGNGKSGGGIIPRSNQTRSTIYHNLLAVYHPDDSYRGFNCMWQSLTVSSNPDNAQASGFNEGGSNHVGDLYGMDVVNDKYDYIDYDYTRSYHDDGRVTQARRQLVYFRPVNPASPADKEFVVINDRMNTASTDYQQRWLLHMSFEPQLVDGSWTSTGPGWWESTNGSTLRISNTFGGYHGAMFVKTLFPENHKLVKVGGDGHWFDDADGRDMTDGGPFTELGAAWCGSYRTEVRPTEVSTYNNMLHVMQIGDANTLTTMAPVTKLSGSNYVAALIDQNRFILFSNSENKIGTVEYTINSTQSVLHVIGDLTPYAEVTVKKNGAVIFTGNAHEGGSLHFEDNPGGQATYQVSVIGTGLDEGNINDTPRNFELLPNYPNPFNPSTYIRYSVAKMGRVKIRVYDLSGELVKELVNGIQAVGNYSQQWDGRNLLGEPSPSGMYLISMEAGNFTASTKALLIK